MSSTNGNHIPFFKMTGCGNDFIIVDNRCSILDPGNCRGIVRSICRRRFSVGADGFILIEDDPQVDFGWRFFNADGSEAEMCGNGARCAARFAHLTGIVKNPKMRFRTLTGIISAEIMNGERVKVEVTQPRDLMIESELNAAGRRFRFGFIDTGVPHAVIFVDDGKELKHLDVSRWGKRLRYHLHFAPRGTNVNFVSVVDQHTLLVRTYERGVEEETRACGTGATAAALLASIHGRVGGSPVHVITSGGETLTISFEQNGTQFSRVYLEGDARVVFEGKIWQETLSVSGR